MNRCSTCKWWSGELPHPSDLPHRPCNHEKVGGYGYADDRTIVDDGLMATEPIATGPDFGCIHWEA